MSGLSTRAVPGEVLADRLYVGRTDDGDRIYLDARVTPRGELAMMGEAVAPRCRNGHSAGQMLYRLADIVTPARGLTLEDVGELLAAWRAWHLKVPPADVLERVRAIIGQVRA